MPSTLFGVSYDLVQPIRTYGPLIDTLQDIGAKRITESYWVVPGGGAGTAESLRDYLLNYLDGDDRIFVSEIVDWASYNTIMTP